MKKDWTGNTVAYSKTLGASNHAAHEREKNDYYATEPKAVEMLLELEDFTQLHIWECACGEGHLSKAMLQKGLCVHSTDIIDRGFGGVYDFLSHENLSWKGHIITNPPYKYAQRFIEKALAITDIGCKIAMFLPIRYTEGKSRKKLFQKHPPKTVYVSASRIKCAINGEFDKMTGSAVSYAWFVWENGHKGDTILKWFN